MSQNSFGKLPNINPRLFFEWNFIQNRTLEFYCFYIINLKIKPRIFTSFILQMTKHDNLKWILV